jgi:hypothetical protein
MNAEWRALPANGRRVRSLLSAAGVVIALGVAACGSSSNSGSSTHSAATTTSIASTTTSTTTISAADKRIARDATLRLTDFPTGWEANDQSSPATKSDCQGLIGAKAAASGGASSPDFASSDNSQVSNAVVIFPDASTAKHWYTELSSQATRECLGKQIGTEATKTASREGLTVGQITTGSVAIAPVGNERGAGRLTIPVSEGSLNVNVFSDLVVIRVDRGVQLLFLTNVLAPFDATLGAKLVKTAADRLTSALQQAQ